MMLLEICGQVVRVLAPVIHRSWVRVPGQSELIEMMGDQRGQEGKNGTSFGEKGLKERKGFEGEKRV